MQHVFPFKEGRFPARKRPLPGGENSKGFLDGAGMILFVKIQIFTFTSHLNKKAKINLVSKKDFNFLFYFQLSELEQRVLEAEGRAEEAEDKVLSLLFISIFVN